MTAPTVTFVNGNVDWDTANSTLTRTVTFTGQAGDLLVVCAALENNSRGWPASPVTNNGTALTWNPVGAPYDPTGEACMAGMWYATLDTARTIICTVTTTGSGSPSYGAGGWLIDGTTSDGFGTEATANNAAGSGAPSVAISTTAADSAIVCLNADWNATSGARTYRQINSANPAEDRYDGTAGSNYIIECFRYANAGASGAKTAGLTVPSTQRYIIYALEILGTSASTPNEGSASGAVGWAGSATGARESRGAASGTIGWAGSATGDSPPNDGSATGAVGWAGAATGTTTRRGSAAGTVGWAGSATGARTSAGAATGAIGWAGSATGARASAGAAAGTVTWAGSAVGQQPPNEGSAAGAVTWVGASAGTTNKTGASVGAITWAGAATGSEPAAGAAAGAIAWVGAATGSEPAGGAASGTIGWAGTAVGVAPAVGVNEGSAGGTITWTGTAAGARVSAGAASGTVGWAGAATGSEPAGGTASGAIGWAGAAVGVAPTLDAAEGSATGTITWTGTAAGARTSAGAAAGAIGWAGVANGAMPTGLDTPFLTGQVNGHTAELSWTTVADANAYDVERDGSIIIRVLAPQTTYDDLNRTPGESYDYRVRAVR